MCIGFFFRKKKRKLSSRILYLPRSIQFPGSSPGPQTDFTSHAPTSPTQPPRPSQRLASPIPLLDSRYRRRRPGSDKCPTVGEARRNSIHRVVAVVAVVAVVVVVGLCSMQSRSDPAYASPPRTRRASRWRRRGARGLATWPKSERRCCRTAASTKWSVSNGNWSTLVRTPLVGARG